MIVGAALSVCVLLLLIVLSCAALRELDRPPLIVGGPVFTHADVPLAVVISTEFDHFPRHELMVAVEDAGSFYRRRTGQTLFVLESLDSGSAVVPILPWRPGLHIEEADQGKAAWTVVRGHTDGTRSIAIYVRPKAAEDKSRHALKLLIAHELGHALGLGHDYDPSSIMHTPVNLNAGLSTPQRDFLRAWY